MTQPPPLGPAPEQPPHGSAAEQPPHGPAPGQPHPGGAFGPPPPDHPAGFGPPIPPGPGGFGPPVPPPPDGFGTPAPAREPGGGRGSRRRTAVVGAAVLAVALIVGGGVWYAVGKDDKGDKDGKNRAAAKPVDDGAGPAYEKPREKVPADPKAFYKGAGGQPEPPKGESTYRVRGSWLTDKVYAKASVGRISGLDAATGSRVWVLPKPGMSCAGSPNLGEGNIAVVVTQPPGEDERGTGAPCTEVTAFDVDNGKKLWTKSVTIGYQKEKTAFDQATISGDTVAVGGLYGGAAFDLRSGRLLWKPKQGETCRDVGYGGGDQLVAVRSCGDYGSARIKVEVLDAASGKPRWSSRLPAGVRTPSVISSRPVVVAADSGEITSSGASDVFSFDARGKLRTKIALPPERYMHECGTQSVVEDCRGVTAGNDKLYVATARRDTADGITSTNDIVAFSLATGKTTGEKLTGGDNYPVFPIRMDGGNLLVYKSAPFTRVYSVHGRTLKQTLLLDAGTRPSSLAPLRSELRFTHSKLYISGDLISRPTSKRSKPTMVFGFAAK
ncbi:outer membrane protein assembly factor BamB family protein [Streptomyces aureocirculatus]|uniref:outer membrane protein assembly factor BamB family protein n=1 Tax=Streptomyces aureocirculatus TaxID=67275 RepID=UPI000AB3C1E7|nr:PQQ-binding-like beta-propeller repeat protein [Streptomyces aureocirculatus]